MPSTQNDDAITPTLEDVEVNDLQVVKQDKVQLQMKPYLERVVKRRLRQNIALQMAKQESKLTVH